jgi:hypothetical protein
VVIGPFLTLLCFLLDVPTVQANPVRGTILAASALQAKQADPAFAGFSADRGGVFWLADHSGGWIETPSWTNCHSKDPTLGRPCTAAKNGDVIAYLSGI